MTALDFFGLGLVVGLGVHGVLDLGQAIGADLFPALEGAPAEIAGARSDTLGVESCILVEWHDMRGVRGAKDVAAVSAVVAAQEDAER